MELRSKAIDMTIFVILTSGLVTSIGFFSIPSIFADKCDNNEDNNCNETDVIQETLTGNKCQIDNLDTDHSSKNFYNNTLACKNDVRNFKNLATIPDQFAATS